MAYASNSLNSEISMDKKSAGSPNMISVMSSRSGEKPPLANYQIEQKTYYEELQKKENERKQMLEEKEMKGFTGKPQINKKSKSLKRKVDDLLTWKENQDKKREEEW